MIQLCKRWSQKVDRINDISSGQYSVNKNITFKTSILGPYIRDYSNAYIVVKESINLKEIMMIKKEMKS